MSEQPVHDAVSGPQIEPTQDTGTVWDNDHAMRVYAGFIGLVEQVESLLRRAGRGDWRMPLLCLVAARGIRSPLKVLARLFTGGDRQVPHVYLSAAAGGDLRAMLHQVYEGLAGGHFGGDPLRFRHFALVEWLMTVDLRGVAVDKRQQRLARELRRNLGLRTPRDASGAAQALGGWPGLALWLAAVVLPAAALRVLLTGGLFGLGREFRWFMRQQYLAPRLAGSFLAFASRLTIGVRDAEVSAQIDRLLVHAFLQDLRMQYQRRPWRPAAWRRTAYPLLLLDDACVGSAGYDLLRIVNAVRNETGRSDPLLVITCGQDVPPDGVAPSAATVVGRLVPLEGIKGACRAWHDLIPAARRARNDAAWYLPVSIPDADLGAFQDRLPQVGAPPVPQLARPLVQLGLVLALLVGGGGWYAPEMKHLVDEYQADCLPVHPDGRVGTMLAADGQCLGYTDNASQVFSHDNQLIAVQEKIFTQNRRSAEASTIQKYHPRVTLVYLGSLTKPNAVGGVETFAAEREELQGMAAAQARAFLDASNNPTSPYLTIVLSNAGQEMSHADLVVPMLADLAKHDATVLGVVGLVESRTGTKEAIKRLGKVGLPVIAPTLSADGIADASDHYLQISAPNIDEAEFVFAHATQVLKAKKIYNFYTYGSKGQAAQAGDLYVNTLREDLSRAYGGRPDYQESFWAPNVDLHGVCADTFTDGVVFFGGRYSEFGAFVGQLASDCNGKASLIADDSVNRYMANDQLRLTAPQNLPLTYVSKGSLAFCDRLATATDTERQYFRTDVQSVLGLCNGDVPIGERVGLAYDATRMLVKAVDMLAATAGGGNWTPSRITPSEVYNQVRQMAKPAPGIPYQGVTGLISFDPNGLADHKRLALLCAHDIQQAFRSTNQVPQEVDRTTPSGGEYAEQPLTRKRCV